MLLKAVSGEGVVFKTHADGPPRGNRCLSASNVRLAMAYTAKAHSQRAASLPRRLRVSTMRDLRLPTQHVPCELSTLTPPSIPIAARAYWSVLLMKAYWLWSWCLPTLIDIRSSIIVWFLPVLCAQYAILVCKPHSCMAPGCVSERQYSSLQYNACNLQVNGEGGLP